MTSSDETSGDSGQQTEINAIPSLADAGDEEAQSFGVDIGGSGIKAAAVNLRTGQLATARVRIPTPSPSAPGPVAAVVGQLTGSAARSKSIGVTFPAVIKNGVALSAANVDKSWIGADIDKILGDATGHDVTVLNDADAAGLAEVRYGAAKGVNGVVMMLTFGTGIGSGLFVDGHLVPNTELGHLELDGHEAEKRAAAAVREDHDLSWGEWTKRVQHYLSHLEMLFTPDLFVLGGGISKKADKWLPLLDLRTPTKAAHFHNDAGIIGAALAAAERAGYGPA